MEFQEERARPDGKGAAPLMAPANVIDAKLYDSIHAKIKKKLAKQGRGWSAYASGQLVQEYKRRGGKYKGKKPAKNKGLRRWYSEKWVNVCKLPRIVPCGRADAKRMSYVELKRKYPYCRPLKRAGKGTPRLARSLSIAQRRRLCSQKKRAPHSVAKV